MVSMTNRTTVFVTLCFCLCGMVEAQDKSQEVVAGKPVQEWVTQLEAPAPHTRKRAVMALGELGPRGEFLVPLLAKRLKDQDEETRVRAVKSLQRIADGSFSSPAVDELIGALRGDDLQIRDQILVALKAISRFDSIKNQVRAGWFGIFPCAGGTFYPPAVSADKKSYRQQMHYGEFGNIIYRDIDYVFVREPSFARLSPSDLMLKACPKSTQGMKSIDVRQFMNANGVRGWGWHAKADPSSVPSVGGNQDKSCIVTKLDTDTFGVIDSVGGYPSTHDMTVMAFAIWPMKSPPRTDFARSLEEFKILTPNARPCDVTMWAGAPDSSQTDRFGDITDMEYDLPDTSYVRLSFIKDDLTRQGEPYLRSVDHSFRDEWVLNYGEQIPLKPRRITPDRPIE